MGRNCFKLKKLKTLNGSHNILHIYIYILVYPQNTRLCDILKLTKSIGVISECLILRFWFMIIYYKFMLFKYFIAFV